jgi:hypothetical protein
MSQQQSLTVSMLALVANLAVGATTLAYVRETEHRITTLEVRLQAHDCRFDPRNCTDAHN